MDERLAVIGAGVTGLTCGVLFAESGYAATIFARESGRQTTSGVAAAIWFPYDAEPADHVARWSLATYKVLRELACDRGSGVSMVELRAFARAGKIAVPAWAELLGARELAATEVPRHVFTSGYAVRVPLIDTTTHLDYLAARFTAAGGTFVHAAFDSFDDVAAEHRVIVNCSGVGAMKLARDSDLEPHRGQVVIVAKLELPYAIVCDDPPLMYAIPRGNDCVLGGTNEISDDTTPAAADTRQIVTEAARVLGIEPPAIVGERVGLRPFRRSGVRLERERLPDGRIVIHNYGHGGSGFTLSWGCAEAALELHRAGGRAR